MTLTDDDRQRLDLAKRQLAATTPGEWVNVPGFPYKNSPDAIWILAAHEREAWLIGLVETLSPLWAVEKDLHRHWQERAEAAEADPRCGRCPGRLGTAWECPFHPPCPYRPEHQAAPASE